MKLSKKKQLEDQKKDQDRKNMVILGTVFLAIILFVFLA